ncbi:MAG: DUF1311 domain-containing protein [Gammaproteobacteria bacterium]|nr:DUF1311 domain-containing protein [Gammaproteobacteria bacterium]
MRIHGAIALLLAALLLPAPSYAASFDCNKATTKLEAFICLNNELSAMDGEVAEQYYAVRDYNQTDPAKKAEILEAQRAFLQYRTRVCPIPASGYEEAGPVADGILSCLKGHYQLRLNELSKQLENSKKLELSSPAIEETAAKMPAPAQSKSANSSPLPIQANQTVTDNGDDFAPRLDGTWKITGVEFGAVSAIGDKEAKPYIGKTLELYKGTLTSPFGNCEACGLARTYTKESAKKLGEDDPKGYGYLKFPKANAYVHELTWGKSDNITMVQIDADTAYVPLDGAYFLLQHTGVETEVAANTPATGASPSATPSQASAWSKIKNFLTNKAMLYVFFALAFAAIAWAVAAIVWAWLGKLRHKIKARQKPVKPEVVLDAKTKVQVAEPELMLNVPHEVKLSTKPDIQLDVASANDQPKNEEKASVNSPANGLLGKNFGLAILGLLGFVFLYSRSESIWMTLLAISLVICSVNFTKIKDSDFIKGIPRWLEDPKSMAIAFVTASVFFVGLATLVSDYNKAHSTDEGVVVNFEEAKARSAADEAATIKKAAADKVIKFVVECRTFPNTTSKLSYTIIAYDSDRVSLYYKGGQSFYEFHDFYEAKLNTSDLDFSFSQITKLNKEGGSITAGMFRDDLSLSRNSLVLTDKRRVPSEKIMRGELDFSYQPKYDYDLYNCIKISPDKYAQSEQYFIDALKQEEKKEALKQRNKERDFENSLKSRKL